MSARSRTGRGDGGNSLMTIREEVDKTYLQTVHVAPGNWTREGQDLYLPSFGLFQSLGGFHLEQIAGTFCFHLIMEGRGVIQQDGLESKVQGGDLYLFRPGGHIVYFDEVDAPWRYRWFYLNGRGVEQAIEEAGIRRECNHYPLTADSAVMGWSDWAKDRYTGEAATPATPMIAAWTFLEALSADLCGGQGRGRISLAQACRQMIDSRFMNPIGVNLLARELGIDRTTLFRQFQQAYGLSPREYLRRVRLARAMELLRNSDQSVKRIGPQCGFDDPHYFSRAFRSAFGLSPREWREGL